MQKIKNHHYGFISSQNWTGQAESDTKKKKKVIVSIHSNPIRNKEFPKNSKRKAKILKTSLWIHFKPKQHGTGGE